MDFTETIFITGFPGFIAGKLVERLSTPNTQFFLLVQKSFIEKAMDKVREIAAKTKTPLKNFALVEGDITEVRLGISNEDLGLVLLHLHLLCGRKKRRFNL